jgi:hypothetical protein
VTVQAHADALLGLLAAAPGSPALVVLDGVVPAGQTAPYVVVYLHLQTPELPESRSVQGLSERVVMTATLHCVGGNAIAARAVSQRARGALLDVVPTVAGRTCWPIRHIDSPPPQRDESTGALVFDQVDLYRLESVPA